MIEDGRVYYNEFDDAAATWIENLIADGLVPRGLVDRRSIKLVEPSDLVGFRQCHFFAGIAGWALAERLARWPPSAELWSGSCPCQPFSSAGNRMGSDDPRHLWPDFFRLIRARRPARVVGEQVAGAPGYGWLDGVLADLEGEDYAGRAVDIPALAVNHPHQRQRLYWVAVDRRRDVGQADVKVVGRRPGLCEARQVGDGVVGANGDGPVDGVGQADTVRPAGQQDAGGPSSHEKADGGAGRIERQPDGDHGHGGHDESQRGDLADSIGSERRRRADLPRRRAVGGTPLVGDDCGERGGGGHGHAGGVAVTTDDGGSQIRPGDDALDGQRPADGRGAEFTAGPRADDGGSGGRLRLADDQGGPGAGGVDLVDASRIGRGEGRPGPDVHGGRDAAPGPDARGGHAVTQGDGVITGLEGHGRTAGGEGRRALPRRSATPPDGGQPRGSVGVWIVCHDGKARRIPYAGFSMLANGVSGRVAVRRSILERPDAVEGEEVRHVSRIAAWRGFGNAIDPVLAAEVLIALRETELDGHE